jgi:hypothetical protein
VYKREQTGNATPQYPESIFALIVNKMTLSIEIFQLFYQNTNIPLITDGEIYYYCVISNEEVNIIPRAH